jgi:hypothetical protein
LAFRAKEKLAVAKMEGVSKSLEKKVAHREKENIPRN